MFSLKILPTILLCLLQKLKIYKCSNNIIKNRIRLETSNYVSIYLHRVVNFIKC